MIKLKDYIWAIEGLAALLLLVAFVFMILNGQQVEELVIRLTGIGILFFTLMRIKPIISSRNEKDYVLVMFSELIIDVVVGIMLLFLATTISGDHPILSFSRLVGLVFFIRGISHFWTTVKRYELHDMISFIVNIAFISFGFMYLYTNNLKQGKVVTVLMILAILLAFYFTYRSYNGYRNYRITKQNAMKMNKYIDKSKKKENVLEDPKSIEEQINPKKIEEPNDDNRPSIDIN